MIFLECQVNLNQLSEHMPVFFRNGDYMMPKDNQYLTWDSGEETTISCGDRSFENGE